MKKEWNAPEVIILGLDNTEFGPKNPDYQDAKYLTTINGKKGWEATFGQKS